MTSHREALVFMAKVHEQTDHYEEMTKCIREVAKMKGNLTIEERTLLSVAYKNVVGAHRRAYRVLKSILTKERKRQRESHIKVIEQYLTVIVADLQRVCRELLTILRNNTIPNATGAEAIIFYHKLVGDYNRYLAEVVEGEEKTSCMKESSDAYQQAYELSLSLLPPTNPIRLGVALNLSVYLYEITGEREKAYDIAKTEFDNAIVLIDELSETSCEDATLILQLLRDNIHSWLIRFEDEAVVND
ncbi:putative 14-3-3 protein [Blattamonas nauphoetae]|uniref:14-3-3 protein n=1 Tax=Blattamonas nauphoetae TaxID=2049346 RepID=A0ABQ9X9A1_9EUKA|nr:putative 14-3-3 protein [Blattamonas nauphoetae]